MLIMNMLRYFSWSFLEITRQSWDSLTLRNDQSKRCVVACLRETDKIQIVGEMLQMSYLAVFITAGFICVKDRLLSFQVFF